MKKTIIIAAIIAVLVTIIAVLALILTGVLPMDSLLGKDEEEAVEEVEEAPPPPPVPTYLSLDPAFTVSFANDEEAQFLQLNLTVATTEKEIEEAISQHNPAIRNALVLLFASQKASVLRSREGKEQLRQQALDEINRVLELSAGVEGVKEVFFTSFVMQ